jgi:hypothetical protein
VTGAGVLKLGALGALAAAIGCGGGGGGGHGGSGGGFTGFGGFGLFDGGPGDGGGSTGTDGPTLQPAPPICGNGIVEAAEACDGAAVTRCAAGQRCGETCTCVAGPLAPADSGALIAQALAAGRIDYFTSLLYRAYRLVGDPRLPAEYDGDFTVDEDTALFLEVSRLWSAMTPIQQQQILPYIARPNDPVSIYSAPLTTPFSGDDGDGLLAAGVPEISCPRLGGNGGPVDFRHTLSTHFVVWSCGSGDAATDPYAAKRQVVSMLAEQVWALEVPSMGAPRDDDFPFDPENKKRIDIYLVPLNQCIARGAGAMCNAITSTTTVAAAPPDSPCGGSPLTSSGYVLMRLDLVPSAVSAGAVKARSDLAHEFFHLVTWGLNLQAQGGTCRDTEVTDPVEAQTSWLTEASGTWAEWAYTPGDDPAYRTKKFRAFQDRYPDSDSLLDANIQVNPAYQAYVYPLFLSQEAGARGPFENFWKAARAAATHQALDDLLNTHFPFDKHFRDFGVKMLNKTLPGDPLAPLLSAADAAVTAGVAPTHMAPKFDLPAQLNNVDLPFHIELAPLAAQVQEFSVPDITRWVDVDLTGAGANLAVDAIVNVKGTWSRRRPVGARFTFCREDPQDDISAFYLVTSNTAHVEGAKVDSNYKVKARVACPGTITGWIHSERLATSNWSYDHDTVAEYDRLSETWTLGMESTIMVMGSPVTLPAIGAHWTASFDHHDSTVVTLDGPCQSQNTLFREDGSGSGTHESQLSIGDAPGGALILAATGAPLGMFNAPITTYGETCDGIASSNTRDNEIVESLNLVSTYLYLMPLAGSPGQYRGMQVVAHQEIPRTGGSDLVDWVVSWDIARTRRP